MSICLCGKEFHSCSNCGFTNRWQRYYCSENCWAKSEEYIRAIDLFYKIISELSIEGKKKLLEFISDYYAEDFDTKLIEILQVQIGKDYSNLIFWDGVDEV